MNTETAAPPTIYTNMQQFPESAALREAAQALIEAVVNMPEVSNEEDASKVSEFMAQCKHQHKSLDKQRLDATEGARTIVGNINAEYKGFQDKLTGAIASADMLLKPYMLRKQQESAAAEQEREEQERQHREEEANRSYAAHQLERQQAELEASTEASDEDIADARERADAARHDLDALSTRAPAEVIPESKDVTGTMGSKTGLRDNWMAKRDPDMSDEDVLTALLGTPYLKGIDELIDFKIANATAKSKKDKFDIPGLVAYNDPQLVSRISR